MQIDDELAAFLECAGSLIVGTVGPDGAPHASRAWGLQVLGERDRVRVQVSTGDATVLDNVRAGRSVAVTITEMYTLRSVQVKGAGGPVSRPTADDVIHGERYRAGFLANVVEVEQVPAELPARLEPAEFLVFEMAIAEVYDQTPGPTAGAPLGAGS